jgi:hypothetical protein
MTEENFLTPGLMDVFSYGRPPVSIDILTTLKGCDFEEAFGISEIFKEEDLPIRFINLRTLRQAG